VPQFRAEIGVAMLEAGDTLDALLAKADAEASPVKAR
jgi:hypothetical protein